MTFGRPRTLREAPRELTAGANQACNYTPDVRPCSFPEAKQTEWQLCDQHVISALSLYQGDAEAEAGMTFTVPVEVSENRFRPGTRADELASECLNLGRVTFQQMRALLELLPAQEVKRFQAPAQVAQASPTMVPGKGIQFGGWVFSGNAGVMNHTQCHTAVELHCTQSSTRWKLQRPFSIFQCLDWVAPRFAQPCCCIEYNNTPALTIFSGGELFEADPQGTHQLDRSGIKGHVKPISMPFTSLNARQPHLVMPWDGVLGAYHIRDHWRLNKSEMLFLRSMGMKLYADE